MDRRGTGRKPHFPGQQAGSILIFRLGAELALIEQVAKAPIPYWIPDVPFGPEREMWRAGHRAMGIVSVADFYSRRNLHAFAALRHAIVGVRRGAFAKP